MDLDTSDLKKVEKHARINRGEGVEIKQDNSLLTLQLDDYIYFLTSFGVKNTNQHKQVFGHPFF